MLSGVLQDIRYARRGFSRSPGLTAAIVVSIALGIAANTTVFSIVNGLFLGSLPVREPERLLVFSEGYTFPYADYLDYREQTRHVFEDVAACLVMLPVSIGGGEPERIWGQLATANFFPVAGAGPVLGRGFTSEEDHGRHAVVVLSDGLWRRRFGGDPGIVGRSVILNNRAYSVIGVAPRGFSGTLRGIISEFWAPLPMADELMPDLMKNSRATTLLDPTNRTSSWVTLQGRLKAGVSREQAAAAVNVVQERLDATYRKGKKKAKPIRLDASGLLPGGTAKPAMALTTALMVVVGLVLLVACANVANLLLARAAGRRKEIGVRLAMGASRSRLMRQLITESILLSLMGAALGLAMAAAPVSALSRFALPLPLPIVFTFGFDGRVFAFTAGLAVLTGILFGLVPALRATRPDLVTALKDQGGSGIRLRRFGLRNALVIVQVSLSLVLLVGAGLFLRSLQSAASIDLGFRADNVLLMAVDPKLHNYSAAKTRQFITGLRERVSALPGVLSVSFLDSLPLSMGGSRSDYKVQGKDGEVRLNVDEFHVGSRFFETMGIPLIRGREFDPRIDTGRELIVNENLARKLFGGAEPVGQVVDNNGKQYEIIGVARNHKSRTIGEEPAVIAYHSLEQAPEKVMSFYGISIVVKTTGDPNRLMGAVHREVGRIDPNLAVFNARTLEDHVNRSMLVPRVCAVLFGVFAAVGLTLAAVGLYGLLNFSVRWRTREIGIRMALGADAGSVLRKVTLQGLSVAGVGLAIGLVVAIGLSRFVASLLYGVSATDSATFAGVCVVLLVVAFFAALLPARRAARIDPMRALRYE
ncbi:MAG: ABC transporter permease [Acidobacteria bacterium]|nr:ABC transporter permease [Acidobacteriota bacterium]